MSKLLAIISIDDLINDINNIQEKIIYESLNK